MQKTAVEVETELKGRLLYLEEWKHAASERLERFQTALDSSRTTAEYNIVARELDIAVEDHDMTV